MQGSRPPGPQGTWKRRGAHFGSPHLGRIRAGKRDLSSGVRSLVTADVRMGQTPGSFLLVTLSGSSTPGVHHRQVGAGGGSRGEGRRQVPQTCSRWPG